MSRSKNIIERVAYSVFQILSENDNEMQSSKIFEEISKRISFDEWENEIYKTTGYIRWQVIFHFNSILYVKAGFLIKKKGIWYLTDEGLKAFKENNSPEKLFEKASILYDQWKQENKKEFQNEDENINLAEIDNSEFILETAQEKSLKAFSDYIYSLGAYDFQDLCSALLRGMGYYTPFIAPKGKDGGIDIIAYRDPLGAQKPRIKIQVKHRKDLKANSKEVRELAGILGSDGGCPTDANIPEQ